MQFVVNCLYCRLHTANFMIKLSPGEQWWTDDATLKVIWGEMNRIAVIFFKNITL